MQEVYGTKQETHICWEYVSPALSHKLLASMGTVPDPANGPCALLITAGSLLNLVWHPGELAIQRRTSGKALFFSVLTLPSFSSQALNNFVQCHPAWKISRDFGMDAWMWMLPNNPHKENVIWWICGFFFPAWMCEYEEATFANAKICLLD